MKKITFVCVYLAKGGAERVMSILINDFANRGCDVQLIMLYENLVEYDIPDNVKIEYLGWSKYKSVKEIYPRIKQLRNAITGDYVIVFLYSAIRDTVIATLGQKRKIIISERNAPSIDPPGWIRQKIRTFSYRFADVIVFQTENALKYFPKSIQKKGIIIPNPIQPDIPQPFRGIRKKTIVAAGRLEPQKNFQMLIKAFARFHKEFPDYRLEIYGSGPLEGELKELVKTLKIDDNVEFCGFVRDVDEKMNNASVYVSSSDFEGISNSMIEALAMGIPSICTDCPAGGAKMAIQDGINGRLVPVGNEGALYSALKEIIENPDMSQRFSNNSIKIREKLEKNKICRMWYDLCE